MGVASYTNKALAACSDHIYKARGRELGNGHHWKKSILRKMTWSSDDLYQYKVDDPLPHNIVLGSDVELSPSNICSILCDDKQCSFSKAAALTNKHSDTGGPLILRGRGSPGNFTSLGGSNLTFLRGIYT